MVKLTKRMRIIKNLINFNKKYSVVAAINLLKDLRIKNFIESVDIAINLGIDPRKADQNIRGKIKLPNGIGRQIRVAAFVNQSEIELAKDAGADLVGMDDLADHIKKKIFNYDVVIASPNSMNLVKQLSSILGPRGLMPNPKFGTVNKNIAEAIRNAKSGQIYYHNDKNGIIHNAIGKIDFSTSELKENIEVFLANLKKARPIQFKGLFIKKISLSTTMGAGINIDQNSLSISI